MNGIAQVVRPQFDNWQDHNSDSDALKTNKYGGVTIESGFGERHKIVLMAENDGFGKQDIGTDEKPIFARTLRSETWLAFYL